MKKFSWRRAAQNSIRLLLVLTMAFGVMLVVQHLERPDPSPSAFFVSRDQNVEIYRTNRAALDVLQGQACVVSTSQIQEDVWEVRWSAVSMCPKIGDFL